MATPTSRWYAFASKFDNKGKLKRVDRERVTWTALGMETSGGPTLVDGVNPPYGGAHALMTDLPACAGCTPHNMTAGEKTPLDGDGAAVFRPVWLYMLGVAPGRQGTSAAPVAASAATPVAAPVTPAAPVPSTAGADAALPTPQIVQYDSDGLSLKAFLYVPAGTGPFAVYLWNHGSEANPSQDKKLAQFWLGQGFAFFKPIRSGHGGNPGSYIVDGEKAIFARENAGTLKRPAANAAILALHERANEDVVNAYKWLIAQPFADKRRIVVGGGSYGGIQTLLTAEQNARQNLGIAAFVAMSPAAEVLASRLEQRSRGRHPRRQRPDLPHAGKERLQPRANHGARSFGRRAWRAEHLPSVPRSHRRCRAAERRSTCPGARRILCRPQRLGWRRDRFPQGIGCHCQIRGKPARRQFYDSVRSRRVVHGHQNGSFRHSPCGSSMHSDPSARQDHRCKG